MGRLVKWSAYYNPFSLPLLASPQSGWPDPAVLVLRMYHPLRLPCSTLCATPLPLSTQDSSLRICFVYGGTKGLPRTTRGRPH